MQGWNRKLLLMGTGLMCCAGVAGYYNENGSTVQAGENIEAADELATEYTAGNENSPEEAAVYPQITSQGIRSLTVIEDGTEEFRISYEPAEYKMSFDCWEILTPYDETVTVDTEVMYRLFDMAAGISFAALEKAPVDAAEAGLTEAADSVTCITVDYVREEEAQNKVEADCTMSLLIGEDNGDGKRYIARKGEEQVYLLSADFLDNFLDLDPFRYILKIPVLLNIDSLSRIEITIDDKSCIMEKDETEYRLDGKKVEKETFTALYQALLNVFIDSELEADPEREKEEVLRAVFHRTSEEAPEIEVVYASWEEEGYYTVSVNGTERFLVDAAEVDLLIEQVQAIGM